MRTGPGGDMTWSMKDGRWTGMGHPPWKNPPAGPSIGEQACNILVTYIFLRSFNNNNKERNYKSSIEEEFILNVSLVP